MKSKIHSGEEGAGMVSFNVVPLVDVVFLLVLFFILTTEMASKDFAVLDLPRPFVSQADDPTEKNSKAKDDPNHIVINVVSKEGAKQGQRDPQFSGEAKCYAIGGDEIQLGDNEKLKKLVSSVRDEAAAKGAVKKDFSIEVRADKDVRYQFVVPVMMTAAELNITKVNITALTDVGPNPS